MAGDPIPEPGRARLTLYHVASPGYLPALGARLRGRDFMAADASSSEPVAIVNQSLADALWPTQDPIGREILIFGSHVLWNDLLAHGLVDELHFMIGAGVIGEGVPAFEARPPNSLRLLDTRTFAGSSLLLARYAVER